MRNLPGDIPVWFLLDPVFCFKELMQATPEAT